MNALKRIYGWGYWLLLSSLCWTSTLWGQQDIYAMDHIVDIRLQFSQANWHQQLDSLKERAKDERLVANVTVDGKLYEDSGIRYKGNSSYFNVRNDEQRKLPFNIKVNYVNKKNRLPGGYETLKLSNVFRDPSYLREVLSYEIAGKYMPAPRANFARVHVNDEYLGLYNLTESVDDDFLDKFYGDDDGVFFKCDPNWHGAALPNCKEGNNASLEFLGRDSVCYYQLYELKSDYGWQELIDLAYQIDKEPEALAETMDINATLWMLAFDNVLVNLDSYLGRLCHNYYLYQDEFGVWHPILWDMNLSFGGFRYAGSGVPLSNEKMQEMSMFLHFKENNEQRPLVLRMIEVPLYRKMYLAHIKTIVEENFANGWYKEKALAIREMISEEVEKDPNRLYSLEDYEKNLNETVRIGNSSIIGVTELMDQRTTYLLNHPLLKKEQPTINNLIHEVEGDSVTISAEVLNAEQVWLFHRPQTFRAWEKMIFSVNSEDGKTFSVKVPVDEAMQYYLVAENEHTARLSPERAAFEFHEIVLE